MLTSDQFHITTETLAVLPLFCKKHRKTKGAGTKSDAAIMNKTEMSIDPKERMIDTCMHMLTGEQHAIASNTMQGR